MDIAHNRPLPGHHRACQNQLALIVEKYAAPEIVDQVVVLRVEGLIKLGESAEFFLAALQNVLLREGGPVVIDLSNIDYIDSTGVGEFVGVTVAAVQAGARVVLAGVTDRFNRLIHVASPATVIEVFQTEDEALAQLAIRARPSLSSEGADLEARIARRRIERKDEREKTSWTTWVAGVESDEADMAAPDSSGTHEPPRILIYSSDRGFAMGVTDVFEHQGFKAAPVMDVKQLPIVVRKYGAIADLIIEDLDSPAYKARHQVSPHFITPNDELFEEFAARAPRLYVSGGRAYKERIGHLPFLSKPVPIEQLTQEVRRLLSQRGTIYRATLSGEDLHAAAAAVVPVSDELLKFLAQHPQALRTLGWRKFEEVVARLLEKSGFTAHVQAGSKDDGVDIIAVQHEDVLEDLVLLVQCKQVERNVGVRVVRELYGVTNQRNASMGLLVTTAAFTQPAHEFQRPVAARLSLRGYEKLRKWLKRVTEG